jgi:integrase
VPTVNPVIVHGRQRYKVEVRSVSGRVRRFFADRAEAVRFARQAELERRSFGAVFSTFSASQRAMIAEALQRLHAAGGSLPEAVDAYLADHPHRVHRSLRDVFEEFLQAKAAAGRRPRYLRSLRYSLRSLVERHGSRPMDDLSPRDVEAWLDCPSWGPGTRRSYRIDAQSLWSFAVGRGYAARNAVSATEVPLLEESELVALSSASCGALLQATRERSPEILAAVAVALFAGVRHSELLQLTPGEIGAQYVEIKGYKAKTRRRRLVTICPALRAWLDVAPPFRVANLPKAFRRARLAAGIDPWPHNALRHTFASFHLALHQDAARTALECGHSPEILFRHYRELVTREEAEAFFALRP